MARPARRVFLRRGPPPPLDARLQRQVVVRHLAVELAQGSGLPCARHLPHARRPQREDYGHALEQPNLPARLQLFEREIEQHHLALLHLTRKCGACRNTGFRNCDTQLHSQRHQVDERIDRVHIQLRQHLHHPLGSQICPRGLRPGHPGRHGTCAPRAHRPILDFLRQPHPHHFATIHPGGSPFHRLSAREAPRLLQHPAPLLAQILAVDQRPVLSQLLAHGAVLPLPAVQHLLHAHRLPDAQHRVVQTTLVGTL